MRTSAVPPGTDRRERRLQRAVEGAAGRQAGQRVDGRACSCSAATSRSWVALARTSITAMTTSTAPKKTRSVGRRGRGQQEEERRRRRRRRAARGHQGDRRPPAGGRRPRAPGRRRTPGRPRTCPRSAGSAVQIRTTPPTEITAPTPSRSSRRGSTTHGAGERRRRAARRRRPSGDQAAAPTARLLEDSVRPATTAAQHQQDQPRAVRGRLRVAGPQAPVSILTAEVSAQRCATVKPRFTRRGRRPRWHDRVHGRAPVARPSPPPRTRSPSCCPT